MWLRHYSIAADRSLDLFYFSRYIQPSTRRPIAGTKEDLSMLRSFFLSLLLMTGCTTDEIVVPGDCVGDECMVALWAENPFVTSDPVLSIEFVEEGSQPGAGWHYEPNYDSGDDIDLFMSVGTLQEQMEERNQNVVVENTSCVLWNVDFNNGRSLCEVRNGSAQTIADTYLLWGGVQWTSYIWEPDDEDGCSVIACRNE